MKVLKSLFIGLLSIVAAQLMILQPSHAEIYKWVDDKGTVHFTEDPSTIPEKYQDRVKSRTVEEDSKVPADQMNDKKRGEGMKGQETSDRAKESDEAGRGGRSEVEMVSWNFSGLCATVSVRNGTSRVQEITEWNFVAVTPKKIVTKYETSRPGGPRPSPGSPSYNPNPVPIEEKNRFSPKPFLLQLPPGQTQTISIYFEKDLSGARLELCGL